MMLHSIKERLFKRFIFASFIVLSLFLITMITTNIRKAWKHICSTLYFGHSNKFQVSLKNNYQISDQLKNCSWWYTFNRLFVQTACLFIKRTIMYKYLYIAFLLLSKINAVRKNGVHQSAEWVLCKHSWVVHKS